MRLDVADFEAGNTDLQALQAAHAALPASGGLLHLPRRYDITAPFVVTKPCVVLEGDGTMYGPSGIRQLTAGQDAVRFEPPHAGSRAETGALRHLLVQGSGGGRGVSCDSDVHLEDVGITGFAEGLRWSGATYYSHFDRGLVTNCGIGVIMALTNNCTLRGVRLTGAFGGFSAPVGPLGIGVHITAGAPWGLTNRIVDCSIEYFTDRGIVVNGGRAVSITGCYFETQQSSAGKAHIHLGPSEKVHVARIEGNYFQGDIGSFWAVDMDKAEDVVFAGNFLGTNAPIGVRTSGNTKRLVWYANQQDPAATNLLQPDTITLTAPPPPPPPSGGGTHIPDGTDPYFTLGSGDAGYGTFGVYSTACRLGFGGTSPVSIPVTAGQTLTFRALGKGRAILSGALTGTLHGGGSVPYTNPAIVAGTTGTVTLGYQDRGSAHHNGGGGDSFCLVDVEVTA